jgi:purine-nucleoside phosphorylase
MAARFPEEAHVEAVNEDATDAALTEAVAAIRGHTRQKPRVAIVLGTGLGGLADEITSATAVPYAEIPGFPRSTVVGHAGRLVLGRLAGVPVAAMQGRFHLYEGYTPQQVVFPIRVLRQLGCETLIVTNAAGGLRGGMRAGDLMLIRDHIGLPAMAGLNPLIGPNDERLGPRFPPMTHAYTPELLTLAGQVAAEAGVPLGSGVYIWLSGPTYETPAELRFLRQIGADAVGMSTVPEVIAAAHMGMRVLALSCITNVALKDDTGETPEAGHLEVVETAAAAGPRLSAVVTGVLKRLATAKTPARDAHSGA